MKFQLKKPLSLKVKKHLLKKPYVVTGKGDCFTQVNSESKFITPEFIFREKEQFQWSPSGFYPFENMLKTISNLSSHYNPYTQKNYLIYVLDDYVVHLMREKMKILFQRGYILVVMGGGIAWFIQANDIHLHRRLKACYCDLEMELMTEKLRADKKKVPTPTKEEMINI